MPHFPALLILIGDDTSFGYLMQRYAKRSACELLSLPFDDDVVNKVLDARPSLVMLELDFPDARGRGLLSALREHPDVGQIPLIVCSWAEEAEWELEEDIALCLRKPILYDDFRAALAEVGVGLNITG